MSRSTIPYVNKFLLTGVILQVVQMNDTTFRARIYTENEEGEPEEHNVTFIPLDRGGRQELKRAQPGTVIHVEASLVTAAPGRRAIVADVFRIRSGPTPESLASAGLRSEAPPAEASPPPPPPSPTDTTGWN